MSNIFLIGGIILLSFIVFGLIIIRKYEKRVKKAEKELSFFKQQNEYCSEAVMVISKDSEVLFANRSARDLFSLIKRKNIYVSREEVELKVNGVGNLNFYSAILKRAKDLKNSFTFDRATITVGTNKYDVSIHVEKSLLSMDGKITCIVKRRAESTKLATQSDGKIDFLTRLPSEFTALSNINSLVIQKQKDSERFGLFLMGIDHFNDIQATLGVLYTNKMLKTVAEYFLENLEGETTVYKMGCDKFLLIIPNVDSDELARKVAKKLIYEVSNEFKDDIETRVTVSFGIACYPAHGENATKLINHAYMALETAQKDSASNLEIFHPINQSIHNDELRINEEIKKGIENREFLLYYQPIFSLNDETMVGAEALIRWNHPQNGLLKPERFLEVAEKTGLIVDIGEYVFREAIKQRKHWDDLGFKKFIITLNLSLREMEVEQLTEKLKVIFDESSVDPAEFNLDISEEGAMSHPEKTSIDFNLFKELGLKLSLDHFGSSYSSFRQLQLLPISTLKIDRSIIFDLETSIDHQILVESIINFAHTLGYKVVAEGVETSKEVEILSRLNCDYAQGYLFSKPLPVFEFQELLR